MTWIVQILWCNLRATDPPARVRRSIAGAGDAGPTGMPQVVPTSDYVGRFAPSPSGPLHAGSLQTALASWLDARTHRGKWLLRIEDVDTPRCSPQLAFAIIDCLAQHGLRPDADILWQSRQRARYDAAIAHLAGLGVLYRCACSRTRIASALRRTGWTDVPRQERPYPGLCRASMRIEGEGSLRVMVDSIAITWEDRATGSQSEVLSQSIGDFVVRRADGIDSYHLAVVVDDEADGVTDVVRGDDLRASTARQIALQHLLGYRSLRYLHLPVVRDEHGQKLSKQQGAKALDPSAAAGNLCRAIEGLGLGPITGQQVEALLAEACRRWERACGAAGLPRAASGGDPR